MKGTKVILILNEDVEHFADLVDEALQASYTTLEMHIDSDRMIESAEKLLEVVNYQEDKIRFLKDLQSQIRRSCARAKD